MNLNVRHAMDLFYQQSKRCSFDIHEALKNISNHEGGTCVC